MILVATSCAPDPRDEGPPRCRRLVAVPAPTTSNDWSCIEPYECEPNELDRGFLDIESNAPGIQFLCHAADVQHAGTTSETEQVLPMCNNFTSEQSTNKPCWTVVVDPLHCINREDIGVKVERDVPPPDGTVVRADCVALCAYYGLGTCEGPS
jgi:hypothetical protein